MASDAVVATSWSVAGAFLVPQQQQFQRLEALQEGFVASEAPVAASRNVTGALQGPRSSSCSAQERCRSVAGARKQQWQRAAAVAAMSCSGKDRKVFPKPAGPTSQTLLEICMYIENIYNMF